MTSGMRTGAVLIASAPLAGVALLMTIRGEWSWGIAGLCVLGGVVIYHLQLARFKSAELRAQQWRAAEEHREKMGLEG